MICIPSIDFVYQEIPEYIGDVEANQIQLNEDGFMLLCKHRHITNDELFNMYSGSFDLRVTSIYNIVWFTFRFGNLHWEEAPFTLHLSDVNDKFNFEKYCQYFRFVVIDTENGRVALIMELDLNQQGMDILQKCIGDTFSLPFDALSYYKLASNIQSMTTVTQIAQASASIYLS